MGVEKINARDLVFQISDGAVSPTWYSIGGMNSFKPNPSENEETADETDFNSGGHYEFSIMQRGAKLEMEGFYMQDPVAGTRDPGQQRLEAAAELVGYGSKVDVRFRYPGSANWKVWKAGITVGEQGGAVNDKGAFVASALRSGNHTLVAVV